MDDREIIADFVIESREHLADIENQLLAIEAGGANPDLAQVNTVFRAIHSVKGAAGFLGFSTIGQLAHDLENVLNLIRNRQLVPSSAVTDVMLRSADRLRDLINCIDQSNEADVSQYIAALQRGSWPERSPRKSRSRLPPPRRLRRRRTRFLCWMQPRPASRCPNARCRIVPRPRANRTKVRCPRTFRRRIPCCTTRLLPPRRPASSRRRSSRRSLRCSTSRNRRCGNKVPS